MPLRKEADVVIVGYGGAGAVAAITAHDLGAEVVVLEKSAQGGGNTRLATSSFTGVIPGELAKEHLKRLCAGTLEEDTIEAYIDGRRGMSTFFAAWVGIPFRIFLAPPSPK
jgi:succinate dehydrogenase/fumarate reductase flavoprotein subunit